MKRIDMIWVLASMFYIGFGFKYGINKNIIDLYAFTFTGILGLISFIYAFLKAVD